MLHVGNKKSFIMKFDFALRLSKDESLDDT